MVPNESPFPAKDIVVSIFLHRNEVAFLLFFNYFFIFIFLVPWDFIATFGLSLIVVSKSYSPDEVHGLLTAVAGPGKGKSLSHCLEQTINTDG